MSFQIYKCKNKQTNLNKQNSLTLLKLIYVLHILQMHPLPFQDLRLVLNSWKVFAFIICGFSEFQTVTHLYMNVVFVPEDFVLTDGRIKSFFVPAD